MNYEKQAEDFLESTGSTIEIVETVPQKVPLWCKEGEKHGIHYSVTIKNARHSYTFDFWDSVNNKEKRELFTNGTIGEKYAVLKDLGVRRDEWGRYVGPFGESKRKEKIFSLLKPSDYSVLSCLYPLYEDTFEEFCSSFGYDIDSRKAYKTWTACMEQDRRLRKLFNEEEIARIVEIC